MKTGATQVLEYLRVLGAGPLRRVCIHALDFGCSENGRGGLRFTGGAQRWQAGNYTDHDSLRQAAGCRTTHTRNSEDTHQNRYRTPTPNALELTLSPKTPHAEER